MTSNGQRGVWSLQVPSKADRISVPNYVAIVKSPLTQLSVSYLNADQSLATMPNGTTLQFVAAPNMDFVDTFPEHVPAQILKVDVNVDPAPSLPPSLEIHMMICYEPISQVRFYAV